MKNSTACDILTILKYELTINDFVPYTLDILEQLEQEVIGGKALMNRQLFYDLIKVINIHKEL